MKDKYKLVLRRVIQGAKRIEKNKQYSVSLYNTGLNNDDISHLISEIQKEVPVKIVILAVGAVMLLEKL